MAKADFIEDIRDYLQEPPEEDKEKARAAQVRLGEWLQGEMGARRLSVKQMCRAYQQESIGNEPMKEHTLRKILRGEQSTSTRQLHGLCKALYFTDGRNSDGLKNNTWPVLVAQATLAMEEDRGETRELIAFKESYFSDSRRRMLADAVNGRLERFLNDPDFAAEQDRQLEATRGRADANKES